MHTVQDQFFEADYFDPAIQAAGRAGLTTPLAQTVVFYSFIQGGWLVVERRVLGQCGPVSQTVPEEQWVGRYLEERREWLKSLGGVLAHSTYRMDTFAGLMAEGKFQLDLPLEVRGAIIDEAALAGQPEKAARPREALPRRDYLTPTEW